MLPPTKFPPTPLPLISTRRVTKQHQSKSDLNPRLRSIDGVGDVQKAM
jgi:hypothetical protein